jgi:hypothetical protein
VTTFAVRDTVLTGTPSSPTPTPDHPEDEPSSEPQPDTGLAAVLWHAGNDWNEAWQRRHHAAPDLLYHYTDAAGLRGIVQGKELWASNAAFLNDSTEVVYIKQVLQQVTAELQARYDHPIVGAFLALLDSTFHEIVVEGTEVFVSCFCENGDLLSQWRGYPPSGGGYAIGFRSEVIARGRLLHQIIYDLATQQQILRELLTTSCEYLAVSDDLTPEYVAKAVTLAMQMTTGNLAFCSFSFKHPGFSEEKEWRLIRVMVRGEEPPRGGTPLFRERGTGLLPYTDLPLERAGDTEPPIATVKVGPTAHPELAVSATRRLLESAGYANAAEMVTSSEIPLRV